MSFLNRRVASVKESATLAIMAKAGQLKAQGKQIFDLSTGEPEIDTPEHIKQAAREALAQGKTKYTPVAGIGDLREALAQQFQSRGVNAAPGTIVVTNGGKQAIHAALDVMLEPGDEVVIPAPYWVSFPAMVQLSGGSPVIAQTNPAHGYKLQPQDLERVITPKTRCLIFNSPSNPTGVGYSANEVRALADVVTGRNIAIIADEVYGKITFDGFQFKSLAAVAPEMHDRIITIDSFSKTYAMTGWRVGCATGPTDIISAMIRHQSQITSNINSIAQYAALAALRGPHDFLKELVQSYNARIERAMGIISEIDGLSLACKPQGAFYLFIRCEQLLRGDPKPAR
ncbi:MAG: pyridoxal phosphate-dependent aminotransferase [Bdellovibrionota bacterium]|nr:MAG: pyridoxal phosphate-dependent aminotransferase [Bdellovibrionota bacterium]